jgi:hypothetical protein
MPGDRPVISDRDHAAEDSSGSLFLSGRRLVVAQVAWVIITLASAGLFIAGVPLLYQQLSTACVAETCVDGQLTAAAQMALQNVGISPAAYAAFTVGIAVLLAVVYGAVGVIIFLRQSREWVALLGSMWLITLGVSFGEGEIRALAVTHTWSQLPVSILIILGGVVLLLLFLLVFPTGRFVPRWTRWIYLVIMSIFLVLGVLELLWPDVYASFDRNNLQWLWIIMVLFGIGMQVYRYLRVSSPIERQQTKWVTWGLLTIPIAIVAFFLFSTIGRSINPQLSVIGAVEVTFISVAFMMIPVTLGFSILRYRLWESDTIINRTLVYGLLTAVLALLYFSSVVLFQQIMQALTGQRSPLAIIASTLLIAALFSPQRRRLQDLIDRRFYRRKYDAAQTLARFVQVAQEEVDLDHLTAELLATVQQTMPPERVSLWLKE